MGLACPGHAETTALVRIIWLTYQHHMHLCLLWLELHEASGLYDSKAVVHSLVRPVPADPVH